MTGNAIIDSVAALRALDPTRVPLAEPGEPLPAVDPRRLSPEALRARFASPPAWKPEMAGDRVMQRAGEPRPAAVLVPIVAHGSGPTVLLTQRTAHLKQHSGQIAFPGGRREPHDPSPVQTALRETREEVGLEPSRVEVIGQLPEYLTGTGYRVTPVVGLVEPGFELRPDPFEVAEAFEVPLSFLMDPRHHQRRRLVVESHERHFFAMPWRPSGADREYFIWGATAAMLRNLYRMLIA